MVKIALPIQLVTIGYASHYFGSSGWWKITPKPCKKCCLKPMHFTFKVQLTMPNVGMVKISLFK
jgi:uncharacterized membrane protein